MAALGGVLFLMSKVTLYSLLLHPAMYLLETDVENIPATPHSLLTEGTEVQGYLAHKKTPTPLGTL